MKKSLAAVFCGIVGLGLQQAQAQKCGTDLVTEKLIAQRPEAKEAFLRYQEEIKERAEKFEAQMANSSNKTTGKYTVPLVFHVILRQSQIDSIGGIQGIYNRIASQVAVLNTDFNAENADSSTIPAVFKPLFGKADIAFGVAHKKPDGTATTGVEIKVAGSNYNGYDFGSAFLVSTAGGGLDAWDNKKYLNIWITDITNGNQPGQILGYAISPSFGKNVLQNEQAIGVVIDFLAFGKRNPSSIQIFTPKADNGRTMVHEIGHFFTLNHIWGNTAVGSGVCSDDDGVADTPPQQDANQSTCPTYPKANCTNSPGGEMFMNFMDYVHDDCMRMFTKGQVARMQSEFSSTGGSYQLQFNVAAMSYPTDVTSLEPENTFDLVPNPTSGIFTVSFSDVNTKLKGISVVNMVGQTVKQITSGLQNQGFSVDLTGMQKGIYMVQCHFETGTVTRKIVLQ